MSSANDFDLDKSKILSFGIELNLVGLVTELKYHTVEIPFVTSLISHTVSIIVQRPHHILDKLCNYLLK